jgi:hypothetical protein
LDDDEESALAPPWVAVAAEDAELRKEAARLDSTEPRRESDGEGVALDGS